MAKKQPKKKRCAECGELKFIENMKTCPLCKEVMCNVCLDEYYGACDNCIHTLVQAEIDHPRADIFASVLKAMKALEDATRKKVDRG